MVQCILRYSVLSVRACVMYTEKNSERRKIDPKKILQEAEKDQQEDCVQLIKEDSWSLGSFWISGTSSMSR